MELFNRPHHRQIAHVLGSLDGTILRAHDCLFGGGTAIALRYGEYRESVDIDFLVSDITRYRDLRQLLTGTDGIAALVREGAVPLVQTREIRADQYGIRTMLQGTDMPIKFEIILEGRIALAAPGSKDEICGIATLTAVDMAAGKLLANSDRWNDDGVFNRDIIDLVSGSPSLGVRSCITTFLSGYRSLGVRSCITTFLSGYRVSIELTFRTLMSRTFSAFVLILLTFLSAISHASPCKPQFEGAFWAEKDLRIVGLDAAYIICPNSFSGVRVGASYFADERFEYTGVTGSLRLQVGETLSPFVGLGMLIGRASHEVDASTDRLDNNRNGQIDEPEEKSLKAEFSAVLYPEIGIAWYTRVIGITLSARRYYSSTFSGNIIYSLGFSYPLD